MAFILGALASLGGGIANYFASQSAAKSQKRAAAEATRAGQDYFQQTNQQYAPYAAGGRSAFDAYLGTMGLGGNQDGMRAYFNSPDYLMAQEAGRKELDAMSAARGSSLSGGRVTAGLRYADDLATRHLQNYRGGLQQLYGTGLQAEGQIGDARRGYLDTLTGAANMRGNASAAGAMRNAGYINDTLGDAAYGLGRYYEGRRR